MALRPKTRARTDGGIAEETMMSTRDYRLPRAADFDTEALLAGVVAWVEMETPSERPDLIDRLLDHVEAQFANLPVSIRRISGRDGCGGQLVLTYAPGGLNG